MGLKLRIFSAHARTLITNLSTGFIPARARQVNADTSLVPTTAASVSRPASIL
jgi:hypothetical protein